MSTRPVDAPRRSSSARRRQAGKIRHRSARGRQELLFRVSLRCESGQVGDVNPACRTSACSGTDVIEGRALPRRTAGRQSCCCRNNDQRRRGGARQWAEVYGGTTTPRRLPGPGLDRGSVSNADATKADVRVRYGIVGTTRPAVRPWPAGAPTTPGRAPTSRCATSATKTRSGLLQHAVGRPRQHRRRQGHPIRGSVARRR